MMSNKRGELAMQQIVIMIILISSFVILLFFLTKLNLGKTTDMEICHNSVIARGSSVLPANAIPLDCGREYICLTEDGSCEQMTKPELKEISGEKEEVYSILAEEMASCWWMFGEGKVNYVGADLLPKLYCSICSQVAFDNSLEVFENNVINEREFYIYLTENNVSGKDETYSEYLYGTSDVNAIEELLESQGASFGIIDLSKQQYVIMGITSEISKLEYIVGGVVFGVAFLAVLPASIVATGVISGVLFATVGATTGNFVGTFVEGLSGNEFLSPTIIEVNSEEFKALDCEAISTLS